ncbi:hypothetical protein PM082_019854 [Marasmius tenuissimus]|nr:hypothetical protein PM082_019854 [Marasmius tenuissimus]
MKPGSGNNVNGGGDIAFTTTTTAAARTGRVWALFEAIGGVWQGYWAIEACKDALVNMRRVRALRDVVGGRPGLGDGERVPERSKGAVQPPAPLAPTRILAAAATPMPMTTLRLPKLTT